MTRERTVIVGASLAGTRAAGAMRQVGYDGEIVLIGDELEMPYQRPPLSKEMLGDDPPAVEDLWLEPREWYADQSIELWVGTRVDRVDASRRELVISTGERVRFDQLLIATGAAPRKLSVPGADLPSVLTLRTLRDGHVLASELAAASEVVIVGAGLIGLEVAAAARSAGRAVTVVERGPTALLRVGGHALGDRVADLHLRHGVALRFETEVTRIADERGRVRVELSNGEALRADLVLVAIGVVPATGWLAGSGVEIADGVIVDEYGETSIPDIFAAGDVARAYNGRFRTHMRLESFANAHDHGVAVGRSLAGRREPFAALPGAGSTQYGKRVQVIGDVLAADEVVLRGDADADRVLGFYLRDGSVVGAFAIDRARDFPAARRVVAAGARVARERLSDPASPLAELT